MNEKAFKEDISSTDESTILDNFVIVFNQLLVTEYESICKILDILWSSLKQLLGCPDQHDREAFQIYLSALLDPKRTIITRLNVIDKLPKYQYIQSKLNPDGKILTKLIETNAIQSIKRPNGNFLFLTPEGFGLLHSFRQSFALDNRYSPNGFVLRNFEKNLLTHYRHLIFDKIERLNAEPDLLSIREIGVVMFFFLNGSIGRERAFLLKLQDLNRAANCVAQAFDRKRQLTPEERINIRTRMFERDLSMIQEKVFNGIYNEDCYYIRPELAEKILEVVKKGLQEKSTNKQERKQQWDALKQEYEHWRTLFLGNDVGFHEKMREIELDVLFQ